MFRSLGSVLCMVVMAAFVFGCGGGGGGTAQMPEPPPVDPGPTQPPEPTDAERIAEARQDVATILSNAQARAGAASSTASALQNNQDATADQRARASNHDTAAQAALADIVSANNAAQAATTLAEARAALADAQTAQNSLNTEATAISSIESAVRMFTNAREQREADEMAQTGGSSLIQHLRDNRKVSDSVLGSLAAGSLLVGATGDNTGSATYPYHKGDPSTNYPVPPNTDRGVLEVTVSVGGTNVSSDSQTGKISGSGRLRNGFDVKDGDGRFATVYTDITVARRTRMRNGNDLVSNDDSTPGINEEYQYVADTDYLLAGLWLDDSAADGSAPVLRAFAFGRQPLTATNNFCTAGDVTGTRECTTPTNNTNVIAGFLGVNESESATYTGGVNGAYFAGGKASHFNANVSLTASFVRGSDNADNTANVDGSKISGEITNIVAGGNSITGSIDLKEQALGNDISGAFGTGGDGGDAAGVIAGHAYTGTWKGQFFGMKATRLQSTYNDDRTIETRAYEPDMPGSVGGSFYVDRQTVGEGDAAFIGAFGAHRP